jgi:hypothetical protein
MTYFYTFSQHKKWATFLKFYQHNFKILDFSNLAGKFSDGNFTEKQDVHFEKIVFIQKLRIANLQGHFILMFYIRAI